MFPAFDSEHVTFVNILDTSETRRSTMYKNGSLVALIIESKINENYFNKSLDFQ